MGLCRDEKEDLLSRLDGARPASPRPQSAPLRPLDASVVVPARLRPRPGGAAPAGSGWCATSCCSASCASSRSCSDRARRTAFMRWFVMQRTPAAELNSGTMAVLGSERDVIYLVFVSILEL